MPRDSSDPGINGIAGKSKAAVRMALKGFGFELRRIRPDPPEPDPSYLHELPEVALFESIESPDAPAESFKVPLHSVVDYRGFGFGRTAWHPYVSVARTIGEDGIQAGRALLHRFYEKHAPETAADAMLGFRDVPEVFRTSPPFLYFLAPWRAVYPEQVVGNVSRLMRKCMASARD